MIYPKTIYKYRDWNNKFHKRILTEKEFFLASPLSFNDPFDCRISENYHFLKDSYNQELYIERMVNDYGERIKELGYDIELTKENFREKIKDIDKLQKGVQDYDAVQLANNFGVMSLSCRWDSIVMWSHYSNLHQGFCIGFDEEKIRKSNLFGKGGLVQYSEKFPERNPSINLHPFIESSKMLYTKSKDWEYEQEFRLSILNIEGLTLETRKVVVPDDSVSCIYLGLEIPIDHKLEILDIARKEKIKVYQISKVPFEYKLNRELLQ